MDEVVGVLKRMAIGGAALISLLVINFVCILFVWAFASALVEGFLTGYATIATMVFVAPFNYALFERILSYIDGSGA